MSSAVSGHKGRDRWMRALAAASDLSTMAIRLALRLCVSFNCKTGQCDPGYPKLAEDMAVSKRTVSRAIDELETAGWVSVDRTGGDNTRNAQINLLIPGAGETRSDDNMLSPEKEPIGATSGDNMLSPENPSLQVTENAPSGDKNRGGQVTDSVAAQITCEPENLKKELEDRPSTTIGTESDHTHSLDRPMLEPRAREPLALVAREPLTPVPRPVGRPETVEAQQPSPSRVNPIVTPANRARTAFAKVSFAWPTDRTDDGGYAAYVAALAAAQGDTEVVLDAIWDRLGESGADTPWLSDALRRIEHDLRYGIPEEDEHD